MSTSPRYDFGLISCTNRKNPQGMTARTLYTGGIFSTQMRHAQQRCDQVLIMSAKFGLLRPEDQVSYYDAYLPELSPQMRVRLIVRMREQAQRLIWDRMPDGQLPTILSYLPKAYAEAFTEADDLLGNLMRRPYQHHAMLQLTALLSAEIVTYGTMEQRR